MAKRAKKPHKTFHINVPLEDDIVMQWLAAQYNQSASMRELIRAAAEQGGLVDLFIGEAATRTPGVRGRAKQPKRGTGLAQDVVSAVRQNISNATASVSVEHHEYQHDEREADNEDGDIRSKEQKRDEREENYKAENIHENVGGSTKITPMDKTKSKARAPSKTGGIKMTANVMAEAGSRAKIRKEEPDTKTTNKTKDKKRNKEEIIKDLMDLMDM